MTHEEMERRKLAIEEEKLVIAKQGVWADVVSKILLPVAVFALAIATYKSNSSIAERQLSLSVDMRDIKLRETEDQIGLRNKAADRAREERISTFFSQNFPKIISEQNGDYLEVVTLSEAVFWDEREKTDVRLRMEKVRASRIRDAGRRASPSEFAHTSLAAGQAAIQAKNYPLALGQLNSALAADARNASAWNSKAYVQFKTGDGHGALQSISQAVSLSPQDEKLRNFTIINAAKILCSIGRNQEGLDYLKAGIGAFPNLSAVAKSDGELTSTCSLKWS